MPGSSCRNQWSGFCLRRARRRIGFAGCTGSNLRTDGPITSSNFLRPTEKPQKRSHECPHALDHLWPSVEEDPDSTKEAPE